MIHRKVVASTSASAVAGIVVAALALAGITVPVGVVGALVTLAVFVAGYLVPGRVTQ